jgi:hypothetical protein
MPVSGFADWKKGREAPAAFELSLRSKVDLRSMPAWLRLKENGARRACCILTHQPFVGELRGFRKGKRKIKNHLLIDGRAGGIVLRTMPVCGFAEPREVTSVPAAFELSLRSKVLTHQPFAG